MSKRTHCDVATRAAAVRRIAGGETASQVAKSIGVPERTVLGWCYKARTSRDSNLVAALGWSAAEVELKLGKPRVRRPSLTSQERAEIFCLWLIDREPPSYISKRFSLSASRTKAILWRFRQQFLNGPGGRQIRRAIKDWAGAGAVVHTVPMKPEVVAVRRRSRLGALIDRILERGYD